MPLEVLDDDGGTFARWFDGDHAEVVLLGPNETSRLVIPLRFAALAQAEKAGRILADAFADVRLLQSQQPLNQDRCRHRHIRSEIAARELKWFPVCEDCGKVWKEKS